MPSASDETILELAGFLPEVNDDAACAYLFKHGYTLHRDWTWSKPGVKSFGDMTRQEFACLLYMCHEWDYGGLHDSTNS